MEKLKLTVDENNIRIDAWLSDNLEEYSRSYLQQLIKEGNVKVNNIVVKPNYKIKINDIIEVIIPNPQKLEVVPENIPLDILYEDDHIIVVNKKKDMVVHPAPGNYCGTLVNALMYHCGDRLSDINGIIRPGIVHRIDKDTSGILVVAKNNTAHEKLSVLLKEHDINRVYWAIVEGVIIEDHGKIDAPIGRHPVDRKKMSVNVKNGKCAVTHFKVLERFRNSTLVELKLETGRTHQIRVHMSYIGYPILCDTVYGKKKSSCHELGQVLHAKILGFEHPTKNEYIEFETELPEYFREILNELRE